MSQQKLTNMIVEITELTKLTLVHLAECMIDAVKFVVS